MKLTQGITLGLAIMVVTVIGCGQQKSTAVSIDGTKYLLTVEPTDAKQVIDAKKEAKSEDEITIVGRIGGRMNPWVAGHGAFTIVDSSLLACSDIEGDNCKFPWDYCCATDQLPSATAIVKFVDENGELLTEDSRNLFKVKELNTVVVTGTAQKDEAGNLTVLASKMYVRK